MGNDNEAEAKKSYDFYVDMILHFQKLFDYKGSIQDILSLPYCLFQDIIIAKIKERQKELSDQKNVQDEKKNRRINMSRNKPILKSLSK